MTSFEDNRLRVYWAPGIPSPRLIADNVDPTVRQVHILANGWVRVFWDDDNSSLHPASAVFMILGVEEGPNRNVWTEER